MSEWPITYAPILGFSDPLCAAAISDFFVAVISAPFFMDYYMRGSWIFGQGVCKLAGYVKNT